MRFAPNVIVLDASAAVDVVLRRPGRGTWVAEQLVLAEVLHAPHLIDVEVASTLRRFARADEIAATRARRALDVFLELRISRHEPRLLLDRMWALRGALSAYDATYVALAEILDIPLVTTDDRLARSTGHRATVVGFAG